MLKRILIGVLIGIVTALLIYFIGVLVALIPALGAFGGILQAWAWLFGLIAALWFIVLGENVLR